MRCSQDQLLCLEKLRRPAYGMRSITETESVHSPSSPVVRLHFPQHRLHREVPQTEPPELPHRKTIWREKKRVVERVVGQESSRKRHTFSASVRFVPNKGSCLKAEIIEFRLSKPTDRYMHRLSNVRVAESILLARPSESSRKSSLNQFYTQQ